MWRWPWCLVPSNQTRCHIGMSTWNHGTNTFLAQEIDYSAHFTEWTFEKDLLWGFKISWNLGRKKKIKPTSKLILNDQIRSAPLLECPFFPSKWVLDSQLAAYAKREFPWCPLSEPKICLFAAAALVTLNCIGLLWSNTVILLQSPRHDPKSQQEFQDITCNDGQVWLFKDMRKLKKFLHKNT